ncbi:MAG: MATE family efflux transporter [Peptostreptococcaceae bacterium]
MQNKVDLTNGNITKTLIKLALPIMGTSFIQMAYNMIDMMWVGKIGSDAVAAVGTAGYFPWFAMALVAISRVGAEVKVAQSIGKDEGDKAKEYIKASIEINMILSILYTLVLILFRKQLIGFFNLGDENVFNMSVEYLVIIACSMIFYFVNPILTSIFNGLGNSKVPFLINTIGLVFNIILDPILIFGINGSGGLGVNGAALATSLSQFVVTATFLIYIFKSKNTYFNVSLFREVNKEVFTNILKLGYPVALQSGLFTICAMVLGVVVSSFGSEAIAAQKVGSQIESISWMVCEGIGYALSSFVGQNYGAQKIDRVEKGCKSALFIAIVIGTFNTLLLVFFANDLFSLFINEPNAIKEGTNYLIIIGYSQVFMCVEIVVAGIFRGLSKPLLPSVIMIIFTTLRIPFGYLFSHYIGIDGVWWSISISSMFKGVILYIIFSYMQKNKKIYA